MRTGTKASDFFFEEDVSVHERIERSVCARQGTVVVVVMRAVDARGMVVLCSGIEWQHEMSPCSQSAVALLERNEKVVTWLMPVNGTIKDQIPVVRYRGGYYSLSLRMMKAIYRHVRLQKGFVNVETVNGITKQRIPEALLAEKIRTQSRFDVCVAKVPMVARGVVCLLHCVFVFHVFSKNATCTFRGGSKSW